MPEFTDQKCPRCGSTLLTNDRKIWCSFVGGRNEGPCSFGLDSPVFVGSFPQRPVPDERAAFQSTILEQPDDDTARLVYADHLRESADKFDQTLGRFIWSGVTLSQFRGLEPAQDGTFFDAIKEQAVSGPWVLATQLGSLLGWGQDEFAWDNATDAPDRITARLIPDRVEGESVAQRRARRRQSDQTPAVIWERGCVTRARLTLDQWCELGAHLLRHCPITFVTIVDSPGLTLEILGPKDGWKLSATYLAPSQVGAPDALGWRVHYSEDRNQHPPRDAFVAAIVTLTRNAIGDLRYLVGGDWPSAVS